MKNRKKRILTLLMVLALCVGMLLSALAAEAPLPEQEIVEEELQAEADTGVPETQDDQAEASPDQPEDSLNESESPLAGSDLDSTEPASEKTATGEVTDTSGTPDTNEPQDGTGDNSDEVKTYTVTWKDWNGEILRIDTDVPQGTTPVYGGETPTRPEDEEYTYTFRCWSPSVSPVTEDAVYTAAYKRTKKASTDPVTDPVPVTDTYTVTYTDGAGGKVFADRVYENLPRGTRTPSFDQDNPKPEREGHTFAGWSPEVSDRVGGRCHLHGEVGAVGRTAKRKHLDRHL